MIQQHVNKYYEFWVSLSSYFLYNIFACFRFLEGGGAGDFTIQGATDGNTNFRIQGATDGHSDFQIQGPSDGGAATFNIQGATDGHSQSLIQGPYDANQGRANLGHAKALQYNDPSGIV